MSGWNAGDWEGLVSGSACPICRVGKPLDTVLELGSCWLSCPKTAPTFGYCCLVLKRHAVELHELEPAEACAFMADIQRVSEALQSVTGAVKLNYEIHGNTIPHLHMHLYPRYRGDPFEGGPIDPRVSEGPLYSTDAYETYVEKLKESLARAPL